MKMSLLGLLILALNASCSSMSYKERVLYSMAGGLAAGYGVGHASAPDGDNKKLHGALVGAAVSAAVGAGMTYFYDEDKPLRKKNNEILELHKKLEESKLNKEPMNDGVSDISTTKLPSDLKKLINPGSWKLYKLDHWVRKDKNTLIHQDKELIFEPSKLLK